MPRSKAARACCGALVLKGAMLVGEDGRTQAKAALRFRGNIYQKAVPY